MECPFCKIVEKQAEAHVLYESRNVIAFLDYNPINEGHILVVPKVHESLVDNMPLEVLTEIMETLQRMLTVLKNVYNMDGYSIMQNGGEFCDFGHGHFHIFPRFKTMDLGGNVRRKHMNIRKRLLNG